MSENRGRDVKSKAGIHLLKLFPFNQPTVRAGLTFLSLLFLSSVKRTPHFLFKKIFLRSRVRKWRRRLLMGDRHRRMAGGPKGLLFFLLLPQLLPLSELVMALQDSNTTRILVPKLILLLLLLRVLDAPLLLLRELALPPSLPRRTMMQVSLCLLRIY